MEFFKNPDCEQCRFKKPKLHQNNVVIYDLIQNFWPLLVSYAGGAANPSPEGVELVLREFYPDTCDRALNIYKIMVYISVAVKTKLEHEESKRIHDAKENPNGP